MVNAEKLILLRTMIGESASSPDWTDEMLLSYLTIAGDKILRRAFPYDDSVTEVPQKYSVVQCEIAAYLLNKRGAEGELSHSENGVNRTFADADVPDSLMRSVTPYVGVM
jgi:hypothetical protein